MPEYNFHCEKCLTEFDEFRTIAEIDIPLSQPCPNCTEKGNIIRLIGSVRLVDSIRLESTKGRLRPNSTFTEVMTRIKKNHPDSKFDVR